MHNQYCTRWGGGYDSHFPAFSGIFSCIFWFIGCLLIAVFMRVPILWFGLNLACHTLVLHLFNLRVKICAGSNAMVRVTFLLYSRMALQHVHIHD